MTRDDMMTWDDEAWNLLSAMISWFKSRIPVFFHILQKNVAPTFSVGSSFHSRIIVFFACAENAFFRTYRFKLRPFVIG